MSIQHRVDAAEPSILAWLEAWYESACDGDWEHQNGFEINSLDNPGWHVQITWITGSKNTPDEQWEVITKRDASDDDWIVCRVTQGCFDGVGDPRKLREILRLFRSWWTSNRLTVR
ncbi:MAG: Imm53 family immunity protein [Acidobacteriota bacterium]